MALRRRRRRHEFHQIVQQSCVAAQETKSGVQKVSRGNLANLKTTGKRAKRCVCGIVRQYPLQSLDSLLVSSLARVIVVVVVVVDFWYARGNMGRSSLLLLLVLLLLLASVVRRRD